MFISPTICNLNEFGLLKVSGKGACQLLQGQLTCNVETLIPGEAKIGAHCNSQGRIISLFFIFHFQDSFYFFMPRSIIPIEINALKKYAVFYKVNISDLSENLMLISDVNPAFENIPDQIISFKIVTDQSYYIFAGDVNLIKPLWNLVEQQPVIPMNAWKLNHIVNGIPFIYPETSEKCLPHDINLHQLGGIDFNKGCYTGQEIIARMQYRAKLKNHLYLGTINNKLFLQPGLDLYSFSNDEIKTSGIVIDACLDEYNEYHALIITDESHAKDNHLFLGRDQGYFKIQALKRE